MTDHKALTLTLGLLTVVACGDATMGRIAVIGGGAQVGGDSGRRKSSPR